MAELDVRHTEIAEASAVADLGRRHNERWSTAPVAWLTADYVQSLFATPGADPDRDFWSIDLDGRLVAWVSVWATAPYTEVEILKYVDPDLLPGDSDRVRDRLLEVALASAEPYGLRAEPPVEPHLAMLVWPDEPMRAVAEARGFAYLRSSFTMWRSLVGELAARGLPSGVTARPIDPARDIDAVTEVMSAFEDHAGDQVFTAEQTRHHLVDNPLARPDLGRIAEDEVGPCSVVMSELDGSNGSVDVLATLRRARGRGIGAALLHQAFRALQEAGATQVRLNVDATNTTGALGLYERAGMTRESAVEIWARPLPRRS